MVKTQIQIPDELYRRVKRLAEAQEWTLAETLRRGAELLLASRPLPRVADGGHSNRRPTRSSELIRSLIPQLPLVWHGARTRISERPQAD